MGEWSEYFEDFPEEDPANYWSDGRFEIGAAAKERALLAKREQERAAVARESAALRARLERIALEAKAGTATGDE